MLNLFQHPSRLQAQVVMAEWMLKQVQHDVVKARKRQLDLTNIPDLRRDIPSLLPSGARRKNRLSC
jgi:hypothetical protein